MAKPKYKISLNDLQREGGINRLIADGHTKQDVMNAVHRESDQYNYGHKDRTDQREMVQKLFDRSKE